MLTYSFCLESARLLIFLSANCCPVAGSWHRVTSAVAPSPSACSSSRPFSVLPPDAVRPFTSFVCVMTGQGRVACVCGDAAGEATAEEEELLAAAATAAEQFAPMVVVSDEGEESGCCECEEEGELDSASLRLLRRLLSLSLLLLLLMIRRRWSCRGVSGGRERKEDSGGEASR